MMSQPPCSFIDFSDMLMITLERGGTELDVPVHSKACFFPHTLNIQDEETESLFSFELVAAVYRPSHGDRGHYVMHVKYEDGTWYWLDDEYVQKSTGTPDSRSPPLQNPLTCEVEKSFVELLLYKKKKK